MTLRIKPLLFALLFPILAASAGTWRSNADSGPLSPAYYPSQPDTHESPWRYGVPSGPNATARLAYWSEQAWRTITIDHTPPPAGPSAYAEQQGPTRTSRVMASAASLNRYCSPLASQMRWSQSSMRSPASPSAWRMA